MRFCSEILRRSALSFMSESLTERTCAARISGVSGASARKSAKKCHQCICASKRLIPYWDIKEAKISSSSATKEKMRSPLRGACFLPPPAKKSHKSVNASAGSGGILPS